MLEACATERDLARPCDLSFSKVLTYYPHDTASDPAVRHGSPPHCLWKAFGEFAVRPGSAAEPGKSAADVPAGIARSEASGAELAAALGELTQALRKYSFEHHRLPKTFNEVVAAGYVNNVPQAPPGKKFEIDPKTVQVVLVKQ